MEQSGEMRTKKLNISKLILPEAISIWENRWGRTSKLADIFSFWKQRYFIFLCILSVLLTYKKPQVTIIWICFWLLLDYIILRARKRNRFLFQVKKLKRIVLPNPYYWDKTREDYNLDEPEGLSNRNLNIANMLRKKWISVFSKAYFGVDQNILDAGCKDGQLVSDISNMSRIYVGMDLNRVDLKMFKKRSQSSAIQGNLLSIPIKDNKLDVVLCMEVLEHLLNPLIGLKEMNRILKPGGVLVFSTDNRSHVKLFELINPIIILERLIGLRFPAILIPPNVLWERNKKIIYYHASFSRTDIFSLLNETNFEVISYFTYYFLPGYHKLLNIFLSNYNEAKLSNRLFTLERIISRIPLIKYLADHWFFILRKKK